MNKNKFLQICFAVIALGAFIASGFFHAPLDSQQVKVQLEQNNELQQSTAEIRLIQAMPGFVRIFLINYLWITTEKMKNDGKFYDAEQKTSMICALQPRFPDVWRNRAWNLAYNVSVTAHTSWERWRWISRAIELLRNKGIVYNPGSLPLYMELSWIYYHKLGEIIDDKHNDYWSFHAAEFHRLLGSPPKSSSTEEYIQWFSPIANAPESLDELLENPDAAKFISELKHFNLSAGLEFIDAYNKYSDDRLTDMLNQPQPKMATDTDNALRKLFTDPDLAAGCGAYLGYCRSLVLREKYNMSPSWMLEMVHKFGPIDWRLVWAHSVYWASYGVFNCKDLDTRYTKFNTARYMLFSLDRLLTYNRATLIYNENNPELPMVIMQPDWRMVDACHRIYIELSEYATGEKSDITAEQFQTGNENFLKKAINMLFMAGQQEKAQYYYKYAQDHYSYKNIALYSLPLDRFVMATLTERGASSRQVVAGFVSALIENAYRNLAYGYDEDFGIYISRAQMYWKMWEKMVDGDPRKVLDPFETLQARIALQVIMRMPLEGTMTAWEYLPLETQQASYDVIIETFSDLCKERGIDINKAFPEPPGIEAYRKLRDKMIAEQNSRRQARPSEAETGIKAP